MVKSRDDSWLINKKSIQLNSSYIDIDKKNLEFKTSSYTFGKEHRLQSSKVTKLGRESYYNEKTLVDNQNMRATSFAKTERSTIISEMPPSSGVGPGEYQVDQSYSKMLPKSASVCVIKGKRFTNVREFSPGPGQYEVDVTKIKHQDPKWSLTKQERELYVVRENSPGPGSYNINLTVGNGQKVYKIIEQHRLQ